MNGIEAARKIREMSPKSKILFVSEHRSREIAEEAMRAGGCGYVVKSGGETELKAALDAVLSGKQFVSSQLESVVAKNHGQI